MLFKKIKKKGEDVYQDVDDETIYEAIKGGLSWPKAPSLGFICVVGQRYDDGVLRVFLEQHYDSMPDAARRLRNLEDLYYLRYWIADCEGVNRHFEEMVYDIVKAQNQDRFFRPTQPELAPNFGLAVHVLRKQLHENGLILTKDGILHKRIEQLRQCGRIEPEMADEYPEIQVLANIVYEFPSVNEIKERRKPKDAWGDWTDDDDDRRGGFMGA